ncbi:MAG TPA: hypothetical protein PLD18_11990 [Flavobacterium sp.]|nr:hypothetical protein [Flavobacterium sp.]HRA72235.1 hypothetical protein [Flavobacterium sp.]
MGFWDVFVKTWQVRMSIKIQKSLENSFNSAKKKSETKANLPEILNELEEKNKSWNDKMNRQQYKSDI